jgi:hypothetical protein
MLKITKQKGLLKISYEDITELNVNVPISNNTTLFPNEFNLEEHMEWFNKGFSIEVKPGISQAKLNCLPSHLIKNYNAITEDLNTLLEVMRAGVVVLYKRDVQILNIKNNSYTANDYAHLVEKSQKTIYMTFKSRVYPMVKDREKLIEQMEEEYTRLMKPQKKVVTKQQITKSANKSLHQKKREQEEYQKQVAKAERLKLEQEEMRRKSKAKKN